MSSVDQIINNNISKANELTAQAQDLLNSASTYASGFINLNWQDLKYNAILEEPTYSTDLPTFDDYYNAPTLTADKPVFKDLYVPLAPEYPDAITIDTSGLFLQSAPAYDINAFDKVAPDIDTDSLGSEIDAVERPNVQSIDAPVAEQITISDVPNVVLPTFDKEFNQTAVGTPDDYAARYKAEYESALPEMRDFIDNNMQTWIDRYSPEYDVSMAQLEAKLAADMESGRALSDEFETALYNRARTRVENERKRSEIELTKGLSKRGFSLPNGALAAGRRNLHQSTADNIAQQATELAIERAKMEIQHVQFVMSMSQGIRQMMINASLQYAQTLSTVNGQAIEHSKQIAVFVAEVYNQLLKKAQLDIDVYRIEGEIYEVRLKSALAQLDEIKLEIEVARLKKDIEKIDVDIFSQRINAENTKIQQYLAILEGIDKKAKLEKLKVELFGEEARAYVAYIQGKEAEYKVYTAALSGDESKLKGELAKVDLYSKQVDAEASKQKVEIARMETTNSYNKNLVEQYESELSGFRAEIGAESARFGGSVDGFKAALQGYTADNEVKLNTYKIKYDKKRLELQGATTQLENNSRISIENGRNFMDSVKIKANTAITAGNALGATAASALSSLNTMSSQSQQL